MPPFRRSKAILLPARGDEARDAAQINGSLVLAYEVPGFGICETDLRFSLSIYSWRGPITRHMHDLAPIGSDASCS